MNLRRWIKNWLNHIDDDAKVVSDSHHGSVGYAIAKEDSNARINFSVVAATGGVVVTINKFDTQKCRHFETIHVLHDDQEIATNIGHIVSMELLKL